MGDMADIYTTPAPQQLPPPPSERRPIAAITIELKSSQKSASGSNSSKGKTSSPVSFSLPLQRGESSPGSVSSAFRTPSTKQTPIESAPPLSLSQSSSAPASHIGRHRRKGEEIEQDDSGENVPPGSTEGKSESGRPTRPHRKAKEVKKEEDMDSDEFERRIQKPMRPQKKGVEDTHSAPVSSSLERGKGWDQQSPSLPATVSRDSTVSKMQKRIRTQEPNVAAASSSAFNSALKDKRSQPKPEELVYESVEDVEMVSEDDDIYDFQVPVKTETLKAIQKTPKSAESSSGGAASGSSGAKSKRKTLRKSKAVPIDPDEDEDTDRVDNLRQLHMGPTRKSIAKDMLGKELKSLRHSKAEPSKRGQPKRLGRGGQLPISKPRTTKKNPPEPKIEITLLPDETNEMDGLEAEITGQGQEIIANESADSATKSFSPNDHVVDIVESMDVDMPEEPESAAAALATVIPDDGLDRSQLQDSEDEMVQASPSPTALDTIPVDTAAAEDDIPMTPKKQNTWQPVPHSPLRRVSAVRFDIASELARQQDLSLAGLSTPVPIRTAPLSREDERLTPAAARLSTPSASLRISLGHGAKAGANGGDDWVDEERPSNVSGSTSVASHVSSLSSLQSPPMFDAEGNPARSTPKSTRYPQFRTSPTPRKRIMDASECGSSSKKATPFSERQNRRLRAPTLDLGEVSPMKDHPISPTFKKLQRKLELSRHDTVEEAGRKLVERFEGVPPSQIIKEAERAYLEVTRLERMHQQQQQQQQQNSSDLEEADPDMLAGSPIKISSTSETPRPAISQPSDFMGTPIKTPVSSILGRELTQIPGLQNLPPSSPASLILTSIGAAALKSHKSPMGLLKTTPIRFTPIKPLTAIMPHLVSTPIPKLNLVIADDEDDDDPEDMRLPSSQSTIKTGKVDEWIKRQQNGQKQSQPEPVHQQRSEEDSVLGSSNPQLAPLQERLWNQQRTVSSSSLNSPTSVMSKLATDVNRALQVSSNDPRDPFAVPKKVEKSVFDTNLPGSSTLVPPSLSSSSSVHNGLPPIPPLHQPARKSSQDRDMDHQENQGPFHHKDSRAAQLLRTGQITQKELRMTVREFYQKCVEDESQEMELLMETMVQQLEDEFDQVRDALLASATRSRAGMI